MTNMSRTVVIGVLLAFAVMSVGTWFSSAPSQATVTAEVIRVIDGDTIVVDLNGEQRTVRYLGVDAPEMDWSTSRHQTFAVEATEANQRLVSGATVELEFDDAREDPYSRLLAHVFTGGLHVNRHLIEQGLAQIYFIEPNMMYWTEFLAAQREARAAARGLWGTVGEPVPAADAGLYVGSFRTIEGTVTSAGHNADSDITFVNLSGGLSLRIYPEGRSLFAQAPEIALSGQRIQVTGLVMGDNARPTVIVRDPELIVVLE